MNVLVCDPISPKGIALLQQRPEFAVTVLKQKTEEGALLPLLKDVQAMIVRSETKITRKVIEAAPLLRVVGRAGVGVDNVDVDAATQRGIVVMNTPGGNTISTAELTFSMLMALARKIPQAHLSMKEGKWSRKEFQGTELLNKTLGILGMGRIGSEVAKRALAFGMKVAAYDPYLSLARAKALQVDLKENTDDVYAAADFITVHMPMTEETKGMVNAAAFAKMKRGARILNCARGGIINEADLHAAIQSGQIGGAALDVYETEPPPADFPLRALPQVVMTPHLGASTEEAQENVGIEVAEAIIDYLLSGAVRNAVNLPNLDVRGGQTVFVSRRQIGPSGGAVGAQAQRPHRSHLRRQSPAMAHRPDHAFGAQRVPRNGRRQGSQPGQRPGAGRRAGLGGQGNQIERRNRF